MSGTATNGPWRDLRKRLTTVALLLPAAIACIWLGAHWFNALLALCIAGLSWEWVRMCGGSTRAMPGMLVPLGVLGGGALAVLGMPLLGLAALLVVAALAHRFAGGLPSWFLAAGVLYIGAAGIALMELRHDNTAGRENVLFLFAVVWASDSAAYLAGRFFGGPKLAPRISPGKTWSGAAGGLVGAMLVGVIAAWWLEPAGSELRAALVAGALGVVSQAGDLVESWIKRRFGVKDSSQLIPGHGGLLDRLDGILAAAPAAALLSLTLGLGVHLWR